MIHGAHYHPVIKTSRHKNIEWENNIQNWHFYNPKKIKKEKKKGEHWRFLGAWSDPTRLPAFSWSSPRVPAPLKAGPAAPTPRLYIRILSLVSVSFHGSKKQAVKGYWSLPGHGTSVLGLVRTEQKPPSPRDHHWVAVYRLPPPHWTTIPSHPPRYQIQEETHFY